MMRMMYPRINGIVLISLTLLLILAPAYSEEECREGAFREISGVLVDARAYEHAEDQFSENDDEIFHCIWHDNWYYFLIKYFRRTKC